MRLHRSRTVQGRCSADSRRRATGAAGGCGVPPGRFGSRDDSSSRETVRFRSYGCLLHPPWIAPSSLWDLRGAIERVAAARALDEGAPAADPEVALVRTLGAFAHLRLSSAGLLARLALTDGHMARPLEGSLRHLLGPSCRCPGNPMLRCGVIAPLRVRTRRPQTGQITILEACFVIAANLP